MASLSLSAARGIVAASQASDAALDTDAFVALLTPDVRFRFGSAPELHGRDAVRALVQQLFDSMNHVKHTTRKVLTDENQILLQADVEFAPKQGVPMTFPYVNVLTVEDDGLISEYRIHIDILPLFAGRGQGSRHKDCDDAQLPSFGPAVFIPARTVSY